MTKPTLRVVIGEHANQLFSDEYKVYRLKCGDITVTRGTWVLLRCNVKEGKVRYISDDAPAAWLLDAEELLKEELKKGPPK